MSQTPQRALWLINTTRASKAGDEDEERQHADNTQPKEKNTERSDLARAGCVDAAQSWAGDYTVDPYSPPEIPMQHHPSQHPSGGRGNDSKPKGG